MSDRTHTSRLEDSTLPSGVFTPLEGFTMTTATATNRKPPPVVEPSPAPRAFVSDLAWVEPIGTGNAMLVFVTEQLTVMYSEDDGPGRPERVVELRLIVPRDALAAIGLKIAQAATEKAPSRADTARPVGSPRAH